MRQRTHFTGAWLTDDENCRLKELCSKTGLSKDALIRQLILNKELKERINPDYKKLLWHIDRIGSNINQIAHRVTSTSLVKEADIEATREEVKKIRRELERWKQLWQ